MNDPKLAQRVKIVTGPMEGGVGEIHTIDAEAETARVYLSGIVHGLEFQGTFDLPLSDLEAA